MVKFGKIGAPKSAKRKAFLASIRKKIKKKSPAKSIKATSPKSKPRRKTTAKKKKRRRASFFNQRTIFKFLRIGALVAPAAIRAMEAGTPEAKVKRGLQDYTGLNMTTGVWKVDDLKRGWTPFVATTLITVGIGKLVGILRRL